MLRNCKVDAVAFKRIISYNEITENKGGFHYEITR